MTNADVVVVGSSLGGLVAATLLAQRGRRVVVVEHADTVGGRTGAVEIEVAGNGGWWIDFGHRDGHDVADCQFSWHYGREIAREAGVELVMHRLPHPLRLHRLPDGDVVDGGNWSAERFLATARELFECPEDGIGELASVLARFATASADDVDAHLPVLLGPWLEAEVQHAGVRRALRLMVTVIFHPRPDEASVGRLMQFFQHPAGTGPFIADDAEAGGMQGLIAPWARAFAAAGGELVLGTKPVEIVVDAGRVRGVVAVDRAHLVREIAAPAVVSTYPLWENFALLDERRWPASMVETGRALRAHGADLLGWVAGLRRLPTVRATGAPESHAGWNRFVSGPERRYHGGYHLPSLTSRRAAPDGKHLLHLVVARFHDGNPRESWSDARARVDAAIAYLHRFYADLDDCLEWSAHQYVEAPQSMSWMWAPVRRHGIAVDGIAGLYLVGATVEGPTGVVDVSAWAGREAARAILGERSAAMV